MGHPELEYIEKSLDTYSPPMTRSGHNASPHRIYVAGDTADRRAGGREGAKL